MRDLFTNRRQAKVAAVRMAHSFRTLAPSQSNRFVSKSAESPTTAFSDWTPQRKRSSPRAGKRALPHYGHHAMRHFFCSNAIEAGCDFKVIAEWLGHKDGGALVARTYGHLRNEHSAAMAKWITFDAGSGGSRV